MSLTVLNKQFLAVLRELSIDVDQFPDKSFDGLFENNCKDSKHFLDWFCENFNRDNILTEEERIAYDELENFKQYISEVDLKNCHENSYPSYDDLKLLDSNYVDILAEELENLTKECKQLQFVKSSLKSDHDLLKKAHNGLMEENHKWKKKLNHEKQTSGVLNSDMHDLLKDVHYFLLKKPRSTVDFSLLNSRDDFDCNINHLFNLKYHEVTKNCLQQDNRKNNLHYSELENNLSIAEYCNIVSSGLLEEKKIIFSNLEEIYKKRGLEKNELLNTRNIFNVEYVPKETSESEILKKDIISIRDEELCTKTKKVSHLELSEVVNQHQLNKIYTLNNFIQKASYFKNLLDFEEDISVILSHILSRSVQNIEIICKLIETFSNDLNKNQMLDSSKYEFISWRSKRFNEVSDTSNEKHPLLTALKKVVPYNNDAYQMRKEGLFSNVTCSIRSLVQSSSISPEKFFSELEDCIRELLGKLLCGPTNQLQFTLIEVQKTFQQSERLLIERKQEIRKLTNKYVSFKDGVTQANREKCLLWTLFLTDPEKLEITVKKIQEDSLGYEKKYLKTEE